MRFLTPSGLLRNVCFIWFAFSSERKVSTWLCPSGIPEGPQGVECLLGDRVGFPGGSDGKESACNAGDRCLIPGPGEFHGQRSLAGYSPWGYRVGHNWVTVTHSRSRSLKKSWIHPLSINFLGGWGKNEVLLPSTVVFYELHWLICYYGQPRL